MIINKIIYYESSNYNPYFNLSFEEKLLNGPINNDLIFYLWQNQNTVVIGKNQCAKDQCNLDLMEDDNILLARRSSGGGAVFHDLGNLNFTFISSKDNFDINDNLQVIKRALEDFNINAYFSGRNDLLVDGFKISGQAYLNKGSVSLHHGTLLINTDLDKLSKYLKKDNQKLRVHGVKSHSQRVKNLSFFNPDITIENIKESLKNAAIENFETSLYQKKIENDILVEKYSSDKWLYKFNYDGVHIKDRFDYGLLDVNLKIKNNRIIDVLINSDIMDIDIINEIEVCLTGLLYNDLLPNKIKLSNKRIEKDLRKMFEVKLCTT